MATGARQTITGPSRAPASYGLFTVVPPTTPAETHWMTGGVQWETLPCRNVSAIGDPDCDPETSTPGLPKNFNKSGPGLDTADPFTIYAPYKCSALGNSVERAQQAARDQLALQEQTEVEWIIWSGHFDQDSNLPGSALPAADRPLDPVAALAAIESWYHGHYGTVNGMQGVVHMGVSAATILTSRQAIRWNGNTPVTAAGSKVVIGTGYGSATLTEGGFLTDRIYITPPPFILRSEVFTSTSRSGDLLDRRKNDLYAIAERTYLVGWDSCPVSYYADLAWPATTPDGPTGILTITSPADGYEMANDGATSLKGTSTAEPGSEVTVTASPAGLLQDFDPATVLDNGNWTSSMYSAHPDEAGTAEVTATDADGNTASITVTVDGPAG